MTSGASGEARTELISSIEQGAKSILLFSAVGVFIGIFVKGYPLLNVWDDWSSPILQLTGADGAVKSFTYADYFKGGHFLPIFFVTVPAAFCPASTPPRRLSSPAR